MSHQVIKPLIVLVRNIAQPKALPCCDPQWLEQAANAILAGGGLIQPLIVERAGIETYRLVAREFEYLAAIRAYALDKIKGESIDAYVIDSSNRQQMAEQLKLFMGVNISTSQSPSFPKREEPAKKRLTDAQKAEVEKFWTARCTR